MARASLAAESTRQRPVAPVKRRRRLRWRIARWLLILGIWAVLVLGVVLVWFARDLPRPDSALDSARRPGLTLEDRSGHPFATFGDVVGDPLRLSDLPPWLPQAAVAIEDRRFWSHPGVDVLGVARAVVVNITSGHLRQGGSTLTQQVAKNLFLTNARTLRRKVQELMLTVWLEHSFSKREILEIWLNRVYLGSGTWGVDAAARMYFGVSARKLNLWQSAVLAGIPRAPSRLNPRADPAAAAARGREVLAAMAETGAITAAQAQAASAQIVFPPINGTAAPWFADWASDQAQDLLPENEDATVRTTLEPRIQAAAETRLTAMLNGPGVAANAGQGAVVVLDAGTGEVRAMVGGRDFRTSPFNRAVLARRQPGSSFKIFVWLAALEKGLTPEDTVSDAPLRIGSYSPSNFEPGYRGDVTLEEALAQSLNTVSVRLLLQAGGPRVVAAVAERLGITDKLPDNATLALGSGEVGVLEMAAAYATLFNGGYAVTPTALQSAISAGRPYALPHPAQTRVVGLEQAGMMVRMLAAVVNRGSGRAAAIPGRVIAGKTGTTQDYRDAWFIGASGPNVIAVWLGNDDNRPMKGVTGGSLPAKLFHDIAMDIR
ncbi:transglycosylase domain-containing protein [Acidisphaera sp. L21]|uniref:transglycosylase domain-containing protein n=1 Tax=Acidisphaera sp. L21 TaxID=1641851 RepID=UPI00131D3AB7|nr:PBP1A family penicillin-binding protein [Acidisphaera sp. L21]